MSLSDVTMPLISAPWLNADGNPLSVTPLPGLRSEVIQSLECSYPGILSPPMKDLLGSCCGLAGTELGSIDFTGCWFQEEPYRVFRPALTLAIDDAERRWIGEVGDKDLPGPIWCVFPKPEVAVYVSDDFAAFLEVLRERTCRGEMGTWLRHLTAQARAVWSRRHALALRPHEAHRSDRAIRGWLMTLPSDAYVYDLRTPTDARGWPYGVVGPSGRHYRCGRELVFAVAGLPAQGCLVPRPRGRVPSLPQAAASAEVSFVIGAAGGPRRLRARPERPARWVSNRRMAGRLSPSVGRRLEAAVLEQRPCA
jgi:hypothetical protein